MSSMSFEEIVWNPNKFTENIAIEANADYMAMMGMGSGDALPDGVNTDVDAYRHAYTSGILALNFTGGISKLAGDLYESQGRGPVMETNVS